MGNSVLRVEVIQGGEVVRTEELDQDVIKVGKLSSSHLRLEDPNVSRIHAVIERSGDGQFSVIDLGSATGTYVNGDKVTKSEIAAGDELQFGDTTIRIDIVDASAVAAAAAEAAAAPAASVAASTAATAAAPTGVSAEVPATASQSMPVAGVVDDDGLVTIADGTRVEPYTIQGYYDEAGNYIPGYYDETGAYHLGYGYYDDGGQWQVTYGYYDASGEWIETDSPVSSVAPEASDYALHGESHAGYATGGLGEETSWLLGHVNDREVLQESFFSDRGGDTLEVAMIWRDHVLSVNSYEGKARNVTIGPNEENDFVLEDPSFTEDKFPLCVTDGAGYAVTFTGDMTGTVSDGDEVFSLSEAIDRGLARRSAEVGNGYAIPLSSRTSVRVDVGETTFLAHFTDLPVLIGAGGLPFDTAPLPYIGVSAVAHILFLILAMTMPDAARSLDLDGFQANDRFVQLMITPEQEEEEEPDFMKDSGDEEAAAKHKGEEGKAGKEDSEQADKKLAIKGPKDNEDLELKKAQDMEVAMNAGIASELMVASPWGTTDTSIGSDAIHALGNLQGDSFGEARGFGGLGLHGAGRGGGGISERGIGLANVGTAGRGGGGRGGKGYGKGAGDLGERSARVPKIVPGKPVVQGSLDKEIIRRVVRQHRNEIKYCYESELQKNKNLGGRVVVRFTISATGSVVSAVVKESNLSNATVERCMTGKIRRWVFPEPKGGGIVIVNYPFNLSS